MSIVVGVNVIVRVAGIVQSIREWENEMEEIFTKKRKRELKETLVNPCENTICSENAEDILLYIAWLEEKIGELERAYRVLRRIVWEKAF